ncbi:hypothetical protein V5O48_015612 [Marasmius crinis-equi]|uniref:Uncharacterized protein n=1 Tax=Marasmius crinis-equi TaxID=585013 RepID=A0ABR3EU47_9AGAR
MAAPVVLNSQNLMEARICHLFECCGHECPHRVASARNAINKNEFCYPTSSGSHSLRVHYARNHLSPATQNERYHPHCDSSCPEISNRETGAKPIGVGKKPLDFYRVAHACITWGALCEQDADPKKPQSLVGWWKRVKNEVQDGPWKSFIHAITKDTPQPPDSVFSDGSIGANEDENFRDTAWRKQFPSLWLPNQAPPEFDIEATRKDPPGIAEPMFHATAPTPDHPHPIPTQLPKQCLVSVGDLGTPISPERSDAHVSSSICNVQPHVAALENSATPTGDIPGDDVPRALTPSSPSPSRHRSASPLNDGQPLTNSPIGDVSHHLLPDRPHTNSSTEAPDISDLRHLFPTQFSPNFPQYVVEPPSSTKTKAPFVLWIAASPVGACLGTGPQEWTELAASLLVKRHLNWTLITKVYKDHVRDESVMRFLKGVQDSPSHSARPHMFIHGTEKLSERQETDWTKPINITLDEWVSFDLLYFRPIMTLSRPSVHCIYFSSEPRSSLPTTRRFANRSKHNRGNIGNGYVPTLAKYYWSSQDLYTGGGSFTCFCYLIAFTNDTMPNRDPIYMVNAAFRKGLMLLEAAGVKIWPDPTLADFLANKEVLPLLMEPAVVKAGGSIYKPLCLPNIGLITDSDLVEPDKRAMKEAVGRALELGLVVKSSVGTNLAHVVLPTTEARASRQTAIDNLVNNHFKDWAQASQENPALTLDLFPVLFAVPFNPLLANKGKVRVSFVNGHVVSTHHIFPVPPGFWGQVRTHDELTVTSGLPYRLKPLSQITTKIWDPRDDEDKDGWLGMIGRQESEGYKQVTDFARSVYNQIIDLELRLQNKTESTGEPISDLRHRASLVHVCIDVGVVYEGNKDGPASAKFQLHGIKEGTCKIFRRKEESSDAVTRLVAKHLYSWIQ